MARSRSSSKSSGTSRSRTTKKPVDEAIEDAEVVDETSPETAADTESPTSEPTEPAEAAAETEASAEEAAAEAPGENGAAEEPAAEPEPVAEETAEAENVDSTDRAPEPAPAVPPEPRRETSSTVVPLLVGGAAAALVGFLVAQYAGGPAGPGPGEMTPEEIAAAFAAKDAEIADLRAEVQAHLSADPGAELTERLAPVEAALDATRGDLGDVAGQLAELTDRVETIAMRPTAAGVDPAEFDAELQAFREELAAAIGKAQAEIAEARAEAQRISEEAFQAEQSAAAQAAWVAVRSAIEGGGEYAGALDELRGLTGTEVPEAVVSNAVDGVPTLADLRRGFAPAAREALKASIRSEVDGSTMDRLSAFLRVQTGARSLEPRDGDDPDAILSRAEAAVQEGDLVAALALVAELPEPGQAAMADWAARAETRLSALGGAQELGSRLNLN